MSSRRFYGGLTIGLGSGYLLFSYDRAAALERMDKHFLSTMSGTVNVQEVVSLRDEVRKKSLERVMLRDAWKSKLIQNSKMNPGYEVRRNKARLLNEYVSLALKNEIKLTDSKIGWVKDHIQQQGNNTNEAERDLMIDSSSSNEI